MIEKKEGGVRKVGCMDPGQRLGADSKEMLELWWTELENFNVNFYLRIIFLPTLGKSLHSPNLFVSSEKWHKI